MTVKQLRLETPEGQTLDRIGGFETEYGAQIDVEPGVFPLEGQVEQTHELEAELAEILEHAPRTRSAIRAHRVSEVFLRWALTHSFNRQFLPTGERLYLDGYHPEYSTPEDVDALGATYRMLAGHVKMARYLQSKAQERQGFNTTITGVNLFANTCSYDLDREQSSWGNHANLLARRDLEPSAYVLPLATHHACRIIWSGAGAVRTNSSQKYDFVLSEKADHIWEIDGIQTIRSRPLVNTRDEPLADERYFRRIHDISGESVFNPLTNTLRLILDSLILRAIEAGETFEDLLLYNPVRAIRDVSHDLTLQKELPLENGGNKSALHIEREMIERALKIAIEAQNITDQEIKYAKQALTLLDELEKDKFQTRLDWVIKYKLIDKELARKKRQAGETDMTIAMQKAVEYHRVAPVEGAGMRLLRDGRMFPLSPSDAIIDVGLALPETRAKLRGYALGHLAARGHQYFTGGENDDSGGGGWEWFSLDRYPVRPFLMPDPYEAATDRFDEWMARVA